MLFNFFFVFDELDASEAFGCFLVYRDELEMIELWNVWERVYRLLNKDKSESLNDRIEEYIEYEEESLDLVEFVRW
jgi:hypothetical protein